MKEMERRCPATLAVIMAVFMCLAGCHRYAHPDNKQAVYTALRANQLNSVEVYQDRDSGVITLRGIVGSADQKAHATTFAQQAAPGYTITNDLQVQSAGLEDLVKAAEVIAAKDRAIEKSYKTALRASTKLRHQRIHYTAEKGTLYLKGSVRTDDEKKDAEDLAGKIPDVDHVVNKLAVKPS